jgi:pimeloyl-ACP methyl ester carboxylesterase
LLQPAPHVSAVARANQHAQRVSNNPLGLANSLRGMGTGQQTPLWSRLASVRQPVLLIVGEHDQRYRRIAERMQAALPRAELAVVAEAGHTVHLDQPSHFAQLVASFVGPRGAGGPQRREIDTLRDALLDFTERLF